MLTRQSSSCKRTKRRKTRCSSQAFARMPIASRKLREPDPDFIVGADFAESPEYVEVIGREVYKGLIRDAYAKLKDYVFQHEGTEALQKELERVANYATLNFISQAAGPTLIRIWKRLKELGVIRSKPIHPPVLDDVEPNPFGISKPQPLPVYLRSTPGWLDSIRVP